MRRPPSGQPLIPRRRLLLLPLMAGLLRPLSADAAVPHPVADAIVAVNAYRVANRLVPLALHPLLIAAAQAHAEDMARHLFLAHHGSDGSMMPDRVHRTGYRFTLAAENLAAGQPTARAAVDSWIGSPPHRANLLEQWVREAGVGFARAGRPEGSALFDEYWVLVVAAPRA